MEGPFGILLVDDNDDLREVTRELLESLGHRVVAAQRAESALRIFEHRSDEFDLLLSELVFPGQLSGLDLAERLRAWKPELGVLFISTHDNHGNLKEWLGNRKVAFLRKPYSVEQLVASLRRATARAEELSDPVVQQATGAARIPAPMGSGPRSGGSVVPGTPVGHTVVRRAPLRNYWRAGLSGLAVAMVVAAFQWLGVDPPALPTQVVSSAQRGAWIEPLTPLADVARAPSNLRWTPVAGADVYRISILAVDDSPLWRGETRTASTALPSEVRELFQPKVVYSWLIEAVDLDGRTMAHSGRLRFQIQGEPETVTERVLKPPS